MNCALVDSSDICMKDKHPLYCLCSGISVYYYQWALRAIVAKLKAKWLWRPYMLFFLQPQEPHTLFLLKTLNLISSNNISILEHFCSSKGMEGVVSG